VYQNLGQWGAIYKPVEKVSLFCGFNENFNTNIQNNIVLPSQRGKQTEFGVKSELLGSFAFFHARVPLTVQQSTAIIQPRTGHAHDRIAGG
jgi:hypothetical protein